jgi:hypothetical protein
MMTDLMWYYVILLGFGCIAIGAGIGYTIGFIRSEQIVDCACGEEHFRAWKNRQKV